MLFVYLRINMGRLSDGSVLSTIAIERLVNSLPSIVAEGLSFPGDKGELTPKEIEVKVETVGPQDIFTKDIAVIILASEHQERMINLDERRELITKEIKELLNRLMYPKVTGFVWILLCPGSFGEF